MYTATEHVVLKVLNINPSLDTATDYEVPKIPGHKYMQADLG